MRVGEASHPGPAAISTGGPALPIRLMASLTNMKHTFALTDEEVVERWIENP